MLAGSCSAEFGSLRFGGGKFFGGEKQNGGGNRGRSQGKALVFCVVRYPNTINT